ncbi:uncharacterized protein LOC107019613 [Solanum pennellii]|uniref:Uncharacterized protein LOC107019613 n=1 Tax=Solanum pennellii TaxID=28526 RepID=A0ABM1GSY4_SOLPN|nr:uncharacterized protein LOC107019613 [Solanum pennellii]
MILDKINISRLMVHARIVEEARAKRTSGDAMSERSHEGGATKNRQEIKEQSNKGFVAKFHPKFPKARDDKVPKPRAKKERSGNSPNEKPTCAKFGKGHVGDCLVGTGNFIGCGKNGHKVRDFPNLKGKERGDQVQERGSSDGPKNNRFYALRSRGEQETSPDVVTDMFKDFTIDVVYTGG